MNKKDGRITLFLEFFFLIVGLYVILFQIWELSTSAAPGNIFHLYNGQVLAFGIFAQFIAGLASLISCWSLWARADWAAGWCLFTSGLLLYQNLYELGVTIYSRPAATIPMIIIILVVLQSFPFLIGHTKRYRS